MSGETATIGVKNYGGSQLSTTFTSTTYSSGTVLFTTGPSNTSATIYCNKATGGGAVYCDDFSLTPVNPPATSVPTNTPTPGGPSPTPAPGAYQLVWSDEFNGTSIDTSKWGFEQGYIRNNELQWYQPQNARVENGSLVIEARRENLGYQCGANPCQYTSASLQTYGHYSWTYGKIEARLKLPMADGTWPAFWTLGENISGVGWPASGEIDILEHIDAELINHAGIWFAGRGGRATHDEGQDTNPTPGDWHTYSIEWDATSIKFFLDGSQFHQADITSSDRSEMHSPQYIILNLAIGGAWPKDPSLTAFPQNYYVDWVRVYQK